MTPSKEPLFRPTFATIDLGALAHNYHVIEESLPKGVGVMAMVKADAYGHGAVEVSKTLESCGVRALGVATVEEGVELRDAGIQSPILVMGGLMGVGSPASERMVDADLTPVIHSQAVLESLDSAASRRGRNIGVHIKVDTGMSRLGVRPESLRPLLKRLKDCPHLSVEGVMTHLADAREDEVSSEQMKIFLTCRDEIEGEMGKVRVWHVANTAAILKGRAFDVSGAKELWVRPGRALYGACDGIDFKGNKLKPVMGLVSRAVLLKHVPEGTRISYEGTFTTKRRSRLAIVPIGYADGYPWSVSGKASVLIRGRRLPVIGRVTMDMIIVDVTDLSDIIEVNDEVVLLGRQGDEVITADDLADWSSTITYEIFCRVSKRMPRIYKSMKRHS